MAKTKKEKPAECLKMASKSESVTASLADAIFFAAIDIAQMKISGTVSKKDGSTYSYEADLKEI